MPSGGNLRLSSESYYTATDSRCEGIKHHCLLWRLKDKTVGVKTGLLSQISLTENQSKYGYKIATCMAHRMIVWTLGSIDAVMAWARSQHSISQGQNAETPIAGTQSVKLLFVVAKKEQTLNWSRCSQWDLPTLKANGGFKDLTASSLANLHLTLQSTVDETTIQLASNNLQTTP